VIRRSFLVDPLDSLAADIRMLILANELNPGSRFVCLATMLGVSRGPIREAIIELERSMSRSS
jgi:DNA-binding GntR family transcriptional regulator